MIIAWLPIFYSQLAHNCMKTLMMLVAGRDDCTVSYWLPKEVRVSSQLSMNRQRFWQTPSILAASPFPPPICLSPYSTSPSLPFHIVPSPAQLPTQLCNLIHLVMAPDQYPFPWPWGEPLESASFTQCLCWPAGAPMGLWADEDVVYNNVRTESKANI